MTPERISRAPGALFKRTSSVLRAYLDRTLSVLPAYLKFTSSVLQAYLERTSTAPPPHVPFGTLSFFDRYCISLYNCYRTVRHEKRGIALLLRAFLMPHCPVQRYSDGVCSLLFHLFFIICHPYIPLHLEEMIFILVHLEVDRPLIFGDAEGLLIAITQCLGGPWPYFPMRVFCTQLSVSCFLFV